MTLGVERLKDLAAGDTVRARYKFRTGTSTVEICGPVYRSDRMGWFYLQLPDDAEIGVRQITTPTTHAALVEVLSVTKPPYAVGAVESVPLFGDVVVEDGGPDRRRWMWLEFGWLETSALVDAGQRWCSRDSLPDRLRVIRRLQDWPVEDDFEDRFAAAQNQIATQIRYQMRKFGPTDPEYRELDRAVMTVEKFDPANAFWEDIP